MNTQCVRAHVFMIFYASVRLFTHSTSWACCRRATVVLPVFLISAASGSCCDIWH